MPSRPGHPHSENLSWMEVPQPLPAAEEQSDSRGSLVPSICGEALYKHERASVLLAANYKRGLKTKWKTIVVKMGGGGGLQRRH